MLAVKSSPIELSALPVIEFTWVCKKLANAPLIAVLGLAEFSPSKYMPDANIVHSKFRTFFNTLSIKNILHLLIVWSSDDELYSRLRELTSKAHSTFKVNYSSSSQNYL